MKIAVVGTGYVGLVTGACFANVGNDVVCVDSDADKIHKLNRGEIPIFEPGLEEMVHQNVQEERLRFAMSVEEGLEQAKVCFIAVGTPMDQNGSADLASVLAVARDIGRYLRHDMIVVNKSTVPVGTAKKVVAAISEELTKRGAAYRFEVVSNPEFLKEGSALVDFTSPDRVVIGADTEEAASFLRDLYAPFVAKSDRFVQMDVSSAEITKYASNAMLATRISFMNEMAGLCETVGADVRKVRLGMGADKRIGTSFLYAGCGYGGSCFPKDVQAILKTAEDNGAALSILRSVEDVNHKQKRLLGRKIAQRFGENLSGLEIAIWGLSFKPNTDDVREAPSLSLVEELLERGASLRLYDPKAMSEFERFFPEAKNVAYCRNKYKALDGADALVLVTEWNSFRSPDFAEMLSRMRKPIIFDGRNQYRAESLIKMGFECWQIGIGTLPI